MPMFTLYLVKKKGNPFRISFYLDFAIASHNTSQHVSLSHVSLYISTVMYIFYLHFLISI